ncbi:right-handed parallel beta-helix repeat-containing protein [candidate division WOR-3 bacterium]|nr:right-handed parallel beta-helix repeat-containing protein [candidate division WOR-3 bacterium]
MSDRIVREAFIRLLADEGRDICTDSRRCRAFMLDLCGGHPRSCERWLNVLDMALVDGVGRTLFEWNRNIPFEVVFLQQVDLVHTLRAMDTAAARWAVGTVALALTLVSEAKLSTFERGTGDGRSPSQPPNIVVSQNGDGDFPDIGPALEAASPGTRIIVRRGRYRGPYDIRAPVRLEAQDIHAAVIEASDRACLLVASDGVALCGLSMRALPETGEGCFGFDIRGSDVSIESCDVTSSSLACLHAHGPGTRVNVRKCRMHFSAQGGLYVEDHATVTVDGSEVSHCGRPALEAKDSATLQVTDSSVIDGSSGGVMVTDGARARINRCEIARNAGGGVGVGDHGYVELADCSVHDNQGPGVAAWDATASGILRGCRIRRNVGGDILDATDSFVVG